MKYLKIIGSIIFITYGTLLIVFHNSLWDYAGYAIAIAIFLFALNSLYEVFENKEEKEFASYIDIIFLVIIAIILIVLQSISKDNFVNICIVFAIWSILREADEIKTVLKKKIKGPVRYINIIESLVLIFFAIEFLFDVYAHFAFHMILLGIEVILIVAFNFLNELALKKRK